MPILPSSRNSEVCLLGSYPTLTRLHCLSLQKPKTPIFTPLSSASGMTFIIGLEMVLINKQTKAQKSKIVSGVAGRNIVAVYLCICVTCAVVQLLKSQLYAEGVYSQTKPRLLVVFRKCGDNGRERSFNARCERLYIRTSASYCIEFCLCQIIVIFVVEHAGAQARANQAIPTIRSVGGSRGRTLSAL